MNYKLIHDEIQLQKFIDFLPELSDNEGYFLILIARKKWYPESGISSAHKLRRETVSSKDKIIRVIKSWEIEEGLYRSNDIPIDNRNLGVYIGFNTKNQYKAAFDLIQQCLISIRNNRNNINVKSMANDVIQGSRGTKHFIDIDVDIKDGEDYIQIMEFIKSVLREDSLTFVKTRGGFHCLVQLNKITEDNPRWYNKLTAHGFASELNIMNDDLIPLVGCNQGNFIPYFIQ